MKLLIIKLLLLISVILPIELCGQTYTSSKSCGSCHLEVSANSKIGMICPHCGVRWGFENQTNITSASAKSTNRLDPNKTMGVTVSNANLRSDPSKNSSIISVVPAFTTVSIISSYGEWYYVKYNYYDWHYDMQERSGYIYYSLID